MDVLHQRFLPIFYYLEENYMKNKDKTISLSLMMIWSFLRLQIFIDPRLPGWSLVLIKPAFSRERMYKAALDAGICNRSAISATLKLL